MKFLLELKALIDSTSDFTPCMSRWLSELSSKNQSVNKLPNTKYLLAPCLLVRRSSVHLILPTAFLVSLAILWFGIGPWKSYRWRIITIMGAILNSILNSPTVKFVSSSYSLGQYIYNVQPSNRLVKFLDAVLNIREALACILCVSNLCQRLPLGKLGLRRLLLSGL